MPKTQDMNLIKLVDQFHSEDRCREYLETLRWPDGMACLRCGSIKISRNYKRHQFVCEDCKYNFSVTAGTILHDTHLPFNKWFMAVYLMMEAKKGVSASQLQRTLGISYKTAWYLCHRIRAAIDEASPIKLKGIVEIDETFVGGEVRGKGLIAAVELVANKTTGAEFDDGTVGAFAKQACQNHGLLIRAVAGNSIAFCPPLIITKQQIDEMIEKFEAALKDTLDYVSNEGLLQK